LGFEKFADSDPDTDSDNVRQGFGRLYAILEIAFAAYSEQQDGTDIRYAIAIQRDSNLIVIMDSRRIVDQKRKILGTPPASIAAEALHVSRVSEAIACGTGMLNRDMDLYLSAASSLIACQQNLHRHRLKVLGFLCARVDGVIP